MILEMLAAAVVAAPVEVSPLVVSPRRPAETSVVIDTADDWIRKPSSARVLSVWPAAAYRARISGQAVLSCRVDMHGLAEECRVVSESPKGKGFGTAALLLRPSFILKPAMGPDGPVAAMMTIPIQFKADDNDDIQLQLPSTARGADMGARQISLNGTRPEMREVTMVDHPVWAQAPGFDDMARAYPAKGGGAGGYAVAHCRVERTGALFACEVRKEAPENHGFGDAATGLARRFRVALDAAKAPRRTDLWVDIPIRFAPPGPALERTVEAPTWLTGFDPGHTMKLFPPEAAAKGLSSGRGVARCVVAPDGSLSDCTPLVGDPDGVGFSEAAVKVASVMKMNPWTADGRPVDGAVIILPVRLNLATGKP